MSLQPGVQMFIKCTYLFTRKPVCKSYCRPEIYLAWFPTSVNGHQQMPRKWGTAGWPQRDMYLSHSHSLRKSPAQRLLESKMAPVLCLNFALTNGSPKSCLNFQAPTKPHGSMFHSLSAGDLKKCLLCCDYSRGWFSPFSCIAVAANNVPCSLSPHHL